VLKLLLLSQHRSPVLDLNMRLGEGSGCAVYYMVMDASIDMLNRMATFEQATIESDALVDIRES